jgi:hypothetical protein
MHRQELVIKYREASRALKAGKFTLAKLGTPALSNGFPFRNSEVTQDRKKLRQNSQKKSGRAGGVAQAVGRVSASQMQGPEFKLQYHKKRRGEGGSFWQGMVGHTCNPSYVENGGRKITAESIPRQKQKTLSKK